MREKYSLVGLFAPGAEWPAALATVVAWAEESARGIEDVCPHSRGAVLNSTPGSHSASSGLPPDAVAAVVVVVRWSPVVVPLWWW